MNKLKEILLLKSIHRVGKASIYNKYFEILCQSDNMDSLIEFLLSQGFFTEDVLKAAQENAEKIYEKITSVNGSSIITLFDDDFPAKLRVMDRRCPLFLFVKGNKGLLKNHGIAVIGTRKPSEWSKGVEHNLTSKIIELSDKTIISGLAHGCDRIAHESALKYNGKTIAVLPTGTENIYPSDNIPLAENILENDGCILSEYMPNARCYNNTFIERDGVIAALSDAVIAIECAVHSGTMHTVDYALEYGTRIGCYKPDALSITKGDYSGNEYMITKKNAIPLSNTNDLTAFLHGV